MIVSTAMAVLPVCLSPMISSLCPLPIGNIESIASIPVSSGTDTDFLSIIPGASCSTGLKSEAMISPPPSIGVPSASTTLPRKPSPTGTPVFLPVRLTLSPSATESSLLKRIHPMLSDLISCTIPLAPDSNSMISPYIAWSMP